MQKTVREGLVRQLAQGVIKEKEKRGTKVGVDGCWYI